MMIDQANRTFICSVVFVDLVGYSKKSVAEQISIKDKFTSLLSDSLKNIAVNDRIILDTGDGAAMSFLGDPEDALFVGMTLRDAMKDANLPLEGVAPHDADHPDVHDGLIRIGINLGPVKLVKDINGHPNIIGDGINVAQRIMSFAQPGQIVVSRSYFDVVSVISDAYAKLFQYEGSRTDKHVREHEIYVVGQSDDAFEQARSGTENRAATTNPRSRAQSNLGVSTGTFRLSAQPGMDGQAPVGFFQDRKKVAMASGVLGLIVVVLIALLIAKKPPAAGTDPAAQVAAAPAATTAPATTAPAPADVPKPDAATPPHVDAPKPADGAKPQDPANPAAAAVPGKPAAAPGVDPKAAAKTDPAKTDVPKADLPPATVNFAVVPWGEIFVNGKSAGVSPPKKNLKLPPGKYKIEIKNTTFAPHTEAIDVKSREEITIRHKFQ